MPNIVKNVDRFVTERAWESRLLADFGGTTARLHWADRPYRWHANTGTELFVVLHGEVVMHYREAGEERMSRLGAGDMFIAEEGEEHVAHPVGSARILVVEQTCSD